MPNEVWSHNIKKQGSPLDETVYRNKNHVLRESNKWIAQAIYLNQSIFHFFICMFNPLRRAVVELNKLFLGSNHSSVCRNLSALHIKSRLFDFVIFFFCLMIHFRAFWVMRCSCWFDVDHQLARQPSPHTQPCQQMLCHSCFGGAKTNTWHAKLVFCN